MNHAVAGHSTGSPDDAAAALRGASLAFRRNPPRSTSPQPPTPSQAREMGGGARTSAASVGRSRSPYRHAAVSAGMSASSSSNGHSQGHGHHDADSPGYQASLVAARLHQLTGGSPSQLQPGSAQPKIDPKSPSFIAATLAASRSVSPNSQFRTPVRKISLGSLSAVAANSDDAVDSEPIAPTGSLISMFERARRNTDTHAPKKQPSRSSPPESTETTPEERRVTQGKRVVAPPAKRQIKPNLSPQPPTAPPASDDKAAGVIPSKRPPTPPVRSSQKISAMPMPKPQTQAFTSPRPYARRSSPPPSTSPAQADKTRQHKHIVATSPPNRVMKPPTTTPVKVRPPSPPSVVSRSTPEVLSPKPVRIVQPLLAPPTITSPPGSSSAVSSHSVSSPSPDPEKRRGKGTQNPPTPPKPRGSHRLVPSQSNSRSRRRGNSDTPPTFIKPSMSNPLMEYGLPIYTPSPSQQPIKSPRRAQTPPPLSGRKEYILSAPVSPTLAPARRRPANASTSNLQLDPLTSAMMASSLASTRLTPHHTGSSLPPPTLPQRQKSPRLLQTLRQPHTEDDEDPDRHKINHRHKLASNKHAHHEGSRKRWRDEVTERERKRYEAVWASNRGFLLYDDSPSQSAASGLSRVQTECVANVVVREIWKRSRLPEDELMEVWDLVDRGHLGMLTRQEFVVGLWLIDQRLRGRKLPIRVSDSVWASSNGVRVKRPKIR